MDIKFLAATLIIANKMIDKEQLNELWEVIKMLDIIELAKKKGMKEGMVKELKKKLKKAVVNQRRKWFLIRYSTYLAIFPSK
ncbi:hypothetical protein QUF90_14510 [Desulfococcaceae bacterium HSG9]|nr:hypothetical protein [Desulfococcaceae bacterium HSG9]